MAAAATCCRPAATCLASQWSWAACTSRLPTVLELDTSAARRRFREWKRCYHKPGMLFTVDASGRKMWHDSRWTMQRPATDSQQRHRRLQSSQRSSRRRKTASTGPGSENGRPRSVRRLQALRAGDVEGKEDVPTVETSDAAAATDQPAMTAGRQRRRRRRPPAAAPALTVGAVDGESDDVVLIEAPQSAPQAADAGQDGEAESKLRSKQSVRTSSDSPVLAADMEA